MTKAGIITLAVITVLVVGGLIYGSLPYSQTTQNPTPTPGGASPGVPNTGGYSPSPLISASTSVSVGIGTSNPAPKSFTVHGNDSGADLTTITVPKGTPVTIIFTVDAQGTYHGGLDFRSGGVNTGAIAPGSSKTIHFTANNSFAFTPYWPSTNIRKPYVINIAVQ